MEETKKARGRPKKSLIVESVNVTVPELAALQQKANMADTLLREQNEENSKWASRMAEIKGRYPGLDYVVASALASIYSRVQMLRKEMINQTDRVRNFYITDVLLSQFSDDALTPDITTGGIIHVWSERDDLNMELTALDEKIHFDRLIVDFVEDLLAYGEYTLKPTIKDGQGIIDITDDLDQVSVIAITTLGEITQYLVMDEKGVKAELKEPYEYIKFILGNKRVRIDLKNELSMVKDKSILKKIPRFIRVGKSLLFPILSKIKELELIEQLVPAAKLAQLAASTLLGITVPPGMDLDKAFQAARNIENQLNRKVGIDFDNKELTIQNIMQVAGRIKAIPDWGEKGELKKMEYRADEPKELAETAEDTRRIICNSVGIPYELIFGAIEKDTKRADLLKRYARYLRRLKMIKGSIVEGIKQICNIHLVNKRFSYKPSEIFVDFYNTMINVDELDKLEFVDATVGMLKTIHEYVSGLTDDIASKHVSEKKYFEFVGNQLTIAGMGEVVSEDVMGEEEERRESGVKPTEEEPGEPGLGITPTPGGGPAVPEAPIGAAEPGGEAPAELPPEETPA